MTLLGDSHNFGRRVRRRAGRVSKPRTLFWEWLVLGRDSPLRALWAEAAERDGLGALFDFLPTLRFFRSGSRIGGEVEELKLRPLRSRSSESRRALAVVTGRALGLWSWLGVSDLHWENLVLGVDSRDRLVFGPLDIELILADLPLPTQTKLLPDPDPEYAVVCQHACGVRRVLPYLGKPVPAPDLVAMASAYLGMLAFLERHSRAIAALLSALVELRRAPIRVCLRGTGDYVRASSHAPWPPLLEAEQEQLARGDIPYFFRLYGRPGIRYYADSALAHEARLPQRGDMPRLEPLLALSHGLRARSRATLRRQGLFAVLGAFDHPALTGTHAGDGLQVDFGARRLTVTLGGGESSSSRRDLRALVSSVYLPCRCGEVRSVFVPPVTRCAAARRGV